MQIRIFLIVIFMLCSNYCGAADNLEKETIMSVTKQIILAIPQEIKIVSLDIKENRELLLQGRASDMRNVFRFVTELNDNSLFNNIKTQYTTTREDAEGRAFSEFILAGEFVGDFNNSSKIDQSLIELRNRLATFIDQILISNCVLLNVAWSDNAEERRFAAIEENSNRIHFVQEGGWLGQFRVKEIRQSSVIIEKENEIIEIK